MKINKPVGYLLVIGFILLNSSIYCYPSIQEKNNKTSLCYIPIAYRAINDKVITLKPLQEVNRSLQLPDELVINPGFYDFEGNTYKMDKPGLYRFYFYGDKITTKTRVEQRIVHNGDIMAFLSAISWVTAHGHNDNNLTQDELEKEALKRKISLTCGPVSYFVHNILEKNKIKSRVILTQTLEE